jgi:hypothetical protein
MFDYVFKQLLFIWGSWLPPGAKIHANNHTHVNIAPGVEQFIKSNCSRNASERHRICSLKVPCGFGSCGFVESPAIFHVWLSGNTFNVSATIGCTLRGKHGEMSITGRAK